MKAVKKHSLLILFILGLLLRLSLLFYDYSWDINNPIAWAKDLHNRGFQGFYETQSSEIYATLFPNYPPLSSFIFYVLYYLHSLLEKLAWQINISFPLFPSKLIFLIQNRTFLAATLKLPAVFADLGIAWTCLLFARKIKPGNELTSKLATMSILFNPAFFYNSALWGQIDSLPIFFVLLSIYLLFFTNKYLLSSLFFVLGILAKPTTLIYLPIYLIFFFQKYKLINFLKATLFGLLIFYLSFIPFLSSLKNPLLPFTIFTEKIMAAQSLPFVTNGAFNFWVLIRGFAGIKDTAPFLFGISYRLWGYIITGFFTVFIVLKMVRHSGKRIVNRRGARPESLLDSGVPCLWRDHQNDIFLAFFLIAFIAFLFLTKMHERYSLLPLPFLLLATLMNRKLLKWFIILSLISLFNLYHSWPVPKLVIITDVLYLPFITLALSSLNLGLFLVIFIKFRNQKFVEPKKLKVERI